MNHRLTQAKRLIEAFIALMVGRHARVHWDGAGGSLDNDCEIHLPPPVTGDAAEIAVLTRLAVHEGGHLMETQRGFADRLTQEELPVFNVLEDPRMERSQVQRYPGASLVLSRGLDEMLQNIDAHLEEKLEAQPESAVHLDMLLRGFLAVAPHGPLARRAPQILDRIAPGITDAQRAAIDEALARLPSLSSSLEAEDAAREFVARLREQQPTALPDIPSSEEPQDEEPDGPHADQPEQHQPQHGDASEGGAEQEHDANGSEDTGSPQGEPATEPQAGDAGGQEPHGDVSPEGGSRREDAQDADSHGASSGDGQGSSPANPDASAPNAEQRAGKGAEQTHDGGSESEAERDQTGGSSERGATGSPEQGAQAEQASGTEGQGNNAAGGQEAPSAGAGGGGSRSQDSGSPAEGAEPGNARSAPLPGNQPAATAAQQGQHGEPFDMGKLLRDAHVARYGGSAQAEQPGGDEHTEAVGEAPTDQDLQRVEALLAQADPNASLEELVEASLMALAESESEADEDTSAGEAAGMSLASAPSSPNNLIEARLQGVQSRLVTILQRELQDKRRRPTRIAYNGGRVMPQRFWRLAALGDTKVMLHRRAATGIDAAATVLLDSSGSMTQQLADAAQVTMAFSLALQRLGVRTRVVRFPGRDTVTETLQRFGESARSCVQRCSELTASGGTPVGAAVATETPVLLQQHKLKNVVVIVTDDQPGDAHTFVSALEGAAQQDVLVVGVGIRCDISTWIPHSVSVQDVNELPEALAKLFRESITEKLAA